MFDARINKIRDPTVSNETQLHCWEDQSARSRYYCNAARNAIGSTGPKKPPLSVPFEWGPI